VTDVRADGIAVLEGLITDITDRKHYESRLIHAESYAQAIVASAAEAVITIDNYGSIESFNRAAEAMFGFLPAEIMHSRCQRLIISSQRRKFENLLQACRDTYPVANSGYEAIARKKSGESFPINFSISHIDSPLTDTYVMLIRDLSEQRRNEAELREQRRLLAHADRLNTLGEMAAGIAHEINQPLMAISSYAQSGLQFLQDADPRLDRLEDALQKLSTQALRAGDVIERVQAMASQREARLQRICGDLLLREVHRLAEVEAHIRNYSIDLVLDGELPEVDCDVVQIQQVILNLLRNGMESMSEAGCSHDERIVLKAGASHDGLCISVIDKGLGISAALAGKLFQPFRSSSEFGMGLGLSISRSIVSTHGSRLEFRNNRGTGATFHFTLAPATRP
jgi:two-component system sensor kinase FixL